jgi:hypothetical protein
LTVARVWTTASTFVPRLSTPLLGKLGSFSRPFRCGQLCQEGRTTSADAIWCFSACFLHFAGPRHEQCGRGHPSYSVNEGRLTAVAELVQRTSTLQGDTTLARLAFNSPVVSPDRFRTFRAQIVRSGWLSFDTVLTVAGGIAEWVPHVTTPILLLFPSAPKTDIHIYLHLYSTKVSVSVKLHQKQRRACFIIHINISFYSNTLRAVH